MEAPRTPAQWFATLVGAGLIAGGVLALVTGSTDFGTVSSGTGHEFIIWRVSGWETILYMATGVIGLMAAARVDAARSFGLTAGLVFAAIAIWGFIDGNDVVSLFAVNTADNVTHAAIGGLGLLAGLASESVQRQVGVGHNERRVPASDHRSVRT